jgi:two-component system chemotaxis response regulator CheB
VVIVLGKIIKVLILDDSMLFREVLSRGLSTDVEIQVVAKAEHPFDAIDKIETFEPDVITCDVHMPKMDGIEFIRQLMPQHPVPIIVISAITDAVFDAMNAGAVDFMTKPNMQSPNNVEIFIRELILKIKEVSRAKVLDLSSASTGKILESTLQPTKKIIAIGASTGGTESIFQILKNLPKSVPGIVIVQHIPPQFSKLFAERLNNQTHFDVVEAKGGDFVEMGKVIIAPGDKHIAINRVGERYKVETFVGNKVNGHCPSVDVLFESVAKECGSNAIGVILTGMGYDGAKGLLSMRRKGARTIGQDESSSVVYGMPKAAFEVGAVEKQLPLNQVPNGICNMLR